jgi:hypothetical protein
MTHSLRLIVAIGCKADRICGSLISDWRFSREQQTPGTLGTLVKAGAGKWWQIIKKSEIKRE